VHAARAPTGRRRRSTPLPCEAHHHAEWSSLKPNEKRGRRQERALHRAAGRGGRTDRRRRAGDKIVLRNWRMPVLTAVLCVSDWPLTGAALLVPVWAVFGWDSPSGDLALSSAAVLLVLCGVVGAVRAPRARVVVTADELRVHNVLSTRRFSWDEVEAVEDS
jgi:hypothetical protein